VIGEWAYNRYAEPRFTGDIDFFLPDDADTERRMRRVLEAFGFGAVLPPPERALFGQTRGCLANRSIPPPGMDVRCSLP